MSEPLLVALSGLYGRRAVRQSLREVLADERATVGAGGEASTAEQLVSATGEGVLRRFGRPMRRVLNATGILLHTNLGRAPLIGPVLDRVVELSRSGCDLEFDLATGSRCDRNTRAGALLTALTGVEAGLVVNNNAAALVLALHTLAAGREVIVSRGELVEIGGSFRVPDLLAAAGVEMVEVGTTNRTHAGDYRSAIGPKTAALLKVFPSNYRMEGYVASVEVAGLAEIAVEAGVDLIVDEGSGLLSPSDREPLRNHPSVRECAAAGATVTCSSADKLLGGPQAGLLCGSREAVRACREASMYRAVRPGRMVLAALEEVLRRHLAGEALAIDSLWPPADDHRPRLERLADAVGGSIVPFDAYLGGGAAPEAAVPGWAVAVAVGPGVAAGLRSGDPPVVGVERDGRLHLDLRTVDPGDDDELRDAVLRRLAQEPR